MENTGVITELINTMGLPIAIMLVLGVFVWKVISSYKKHVDEQLKEYRERELKEQTEMTALIEKYHEDTLQIKEALNNNTNATNTLIDLVKTFIHGQLNDGR